MRYSDKELELFEENTEFIVVCKSPLEIEHKEDNSMASGICAEFIIDDYFNVA
jgi:hypothetical protein